MPVRVTFVHRKPQLGNFSLESFFGDLRQALPPDIHATVWECPKVSQGLFPRLRNLIAAAKHQGPVTHVTGDISYVTLLMRRRSTVLTIPDIVLLHRTSGWRRAVARQLWFRLPVSRAACVIVISDAVRDEVVAELGCDPRQVITIHISLSPRFTPDPKPFCAKPARVLMIGSAWNKNLLRQTEALAGLPVVVDFIGVLGREHQAAFSRHGISYTHAYGLTDDEMLARYRQCDLLLFASTYEGFGMPIIEAQAIGRPVITGSTHSMPEVAGAGACLVDAHRVASIHEGVRRVLEDAPYRTSLIEAGFVNVRRFDPALIARQHADVYRALAPVTA